MADYFFDTSALVKRHVTEAESAWVKSLVQAKAGHALYSARITADETLVRIRPKPRPQLAIDAPAGLV
jgi:hypothetical protein